MNFSGPLTANKISVKQSLMVRQPNHCFNSNNLMLYGCGFKLAMYLYFMA